MNRERYEGENDCGHYLAGTLQNKYSQFMCCHVQDSNSVSAGHKPHTLPLIPLYPCADMWPTVWNCVLEFCSLDVCIFDELVNLACAS